MVGEGLILCEESWACGLFRGLHADAVSAIRPWSALTHYCSISTVWIYSTY